MVFLVSEEDKDVSNDTTRNDDFAAGPWHGLRVPSADGHSRHVTKGHRPGRYMTYPNKYSMQTIFNFPSLS